MSAFLNPGETIRGQLGSYVVRQHLDTGGQGSAYLAEGRRGERLVLKRFHSDDTTTQQRLEHLFRLGLQQSCEVLTVPRDLILTPFLGHVTPFVGDRSLEEHLTAPDHISLQKNLTIALVMARGLEVMEAHGITHGDLHSQNVRLVVNARGELTSVHLIDFDNFVDLRGRAPAPPALGGIMVMAPELRKAMQTAQKASPNAESDRFSLAVLMHETILFRSPCQQEGPDDPDAFNDAMLKAEWTSDPSRDAKAHQRLGGFPPTVLDGELFKLFRDAFTTHPYDRPRAGAWVRALSEAVQKVIVCPRCAFENVTDSSKSHCPGCDQPYASLSVVLPDRRRIPIDRGCVPIGRDQLGSQYVSQTHAIFRRIGPETFVEPRGRNGTWRLAGRKAVDLEVNKRHLLAAGDRLRLGDVEVSLA